MGNLSPAAHPATEFTALSFLLDETSLLAPLPMFPTNYCPPTSCAPLSTSDRGYYTSVFILLTTAAAGLWCRSFTGRTLKAALLDWFAL